jgi:hypothetical protein
MGAQLRACLSTTLDSNEDVGYVELQVRIIELYSFSNFCWCYPALSAISLLGSLIKHRLPLRERMKKCLWNRRPALWIQVLPLAHALSTENTN